MSNQIVVFELNNQMYGVDIEEVNEIIRMQSVTSLPKTAHHIEGITNLRGNICTIVNGRTLLGIEKVDINDDQNIIVINNSKVGVIVDTVTEIVNVEEKDKESLNSFDNLEGIQYIDYLVEVQKKIVAVLKLTSMIIPVEKEVEKEEEEYVVSA